MVDQNEYILGIDLGTTNSCSAMFINNKLEIIPDPATGKKIIPSVVCYMENNEVLVGQLAVQKQIEYSQSTIFESKRFIGHKFKDSEVQFDLEKQRLYVSVAEDTTTKKAIYVLKIGDEKDKKFVFPEDVASEIIKYIQRNAEKHLKKILNKEITIKKAVITVPTHYNEYRINTVKEAFKKTNLTVVNVIKEPEAIGIAYGYFHKKEKPTTILTIDIGGGTFGMSILQLQGDKHKIIGSEGSGHLGGDDFEKALRDHIITEMEKSKKYNNLDFKNRKDTNWVRAFLKIKEECSKVITELSKQKNVKFEIKQLDGKNDFTINISQDQYKKLTQSLLNKCETKLKNLFEKAEINKKKVKYSDVDEIVLVGGTTRAPNIKEILEKLFTGKQIFQNLNADEAVAQGAAIFAKNNK